MADMIKVIIKNPEDEIGQMVYIENKLEDLQKAVTGYIECVTIARDLVILCDEEGRLKHRPFNCEILGANFVGPVVLAGINGEEFADVPISLEEWEEILEGGSNGLCC